MSVPTNDELYDNAAAEAWDSVRGWLARHAKPMNPDTDHTLWLDWATANFFVDPEIRGSFKKEFGITWEV